MPQQLTNEIIDAAIAGFEQQRARIDEQIAELRAMRSGRTVLNDLAGKESEKRKQFSAASRRKMAEAQKARWARIKGGTGSEAATGAIPRAKRKMSKEGRERIIAATKTRWARARAEKEAASNGTRKKRERKGRTATAETTA